MQEESTRAKKIGNQIKRDISDIFQKECSDLVRGSLVSVTVVRMSPDYELARVYLSIFPYDKHELVLKHIQENSYRVRIDLAKKLKNQLRIMPEVAFFLDDSLEYAASINKLMEGIVISPPDEEEDPAYIKK